MNQGAFVWYDLATTAPQEAARFYADAVGWAVEDVPDMSYTLLKIGERPSVGVMALPPHLREAGVPPRWSGYVGVPDADAAVEPVTAAGGTLKVGPDDIPGVGRFAVVGDPQGAVFYLFTPRGEAAPEPGFMVPGHVGWHELHARDHEAALAFYADRFGWQRSRAIDMGPMGTYQLFGYGGADRGGMMNAPGGTHPSWLFYFVVEGIEAAKGRVEAGGGSVTSGPHEVPGGAWVVQCRDPHGAAFALVSATR